MKKTIQFSRNGSGKCTDVNFIIPQKLPKIILSPYLAVQIKSKIKISGDFLKN